MLWRLHVVFLLVLLCLVVLLLVLLLSLTVSFFAVLQSDVVWHFKE